MSEDAKDAKDAGPVPAVPAFRPDLAFPGLTDEMIARLRNYGSEETAGPETALFARCQR